MIVIYASWKVNAVDRVAYDQWFLSKVRECRGEMGCIHYQYLVDMDRAGRAINFEVWRDSASLEKHILSDAHIEVVRDNSGKWDSTDFEIEFWDDANGYRRMNLLRSEETVGIHGLGDSNASEAELAKLVGRK